MKLRSGGHAIAGANSSGQLDEDFIFGETPEIDKTID